MPGCSWTNMKSQPVYSPILFQMLMDCMHFLAVMIFILNSTCLRFGFSIPNNILFAILITHVGLIFLQYHIMDRKKMVYSNACVRTALLIFVVVFFTIDCMFLKYNQEHASVLCSFIVTVSSSTVWILILFFVPPPRINATTHLTPPSQPETQSFQDTIDRIAKPLSVESNITEATATGGLRIGQSRTKQSISNSTDTEESLYEHLGIKMIPSLLVSSLLTTIFMNRFILQSKVNSIPTISKKKLITWLYDEGLIRRSQYFMELYKYGDKSRFPYSAGCVWYSCIAEDAQPIFMSVFNGSIFESAEFTPSTILKIIHHWSCQTDQETVKRLLKVDDQCLKIYYTLLRSICTVALSNLGLIGGKGKQFEMGLIEISENSNNDQPKHFVVLGLYEKELKMVFFRAFIHSKNYKDQQNTYQPLKMWISKESTIYIDDGINASTLHDMRFLCVEKLNDPMNSNIMKILNDFASVFRPILPCLTLQLIQQFLNEAMWRQRYGSSKVKTFHNMVSHIAAQTQHEGNENLISRLRNVAGNPFRNWRISIDEYGGQRNGNDLEATTSNTVQRESINPPGSSRYESPSLSHKGNPKVLLEPSSAYYCSSSFSGHPSSISGHLKDDEASKPKQDRKLVDHV